MSNSSLRIGRGGRGRHMAQMAFPQQGQVDWVAFGNTIFEGTFAILQRLSAAGVQPVTYGGGLALANQFRMSDIGGRRMDEALDSLQEHPVFDFVLTIGIGYQSFVRVLAETQIGINCIALCSCLVDTHSAELAAWVLRELWSTEAFPSQFEPSYAQFLALVSACAGVVSGTTFGETVYLMLGEGRNLDVEYAQGASGPRDIAKALHGLFQISAGATDSIEIIGGPDCAFIAAFAYWLLGLTVYVEDQNEVLIFTSLLVKEHAQVKVQYLDIHQRSYMEIASSTYVLGDHQELLPIVEQSSIFDFVARTSWEGCFSRVFGLSFQRLIGMPNLLGTFLGSSARIATAFANGEAKREGLDCDLYINFAEASYGKGFLESVVSLFPEFSKVSELSVHMQRAEDASFSEAQSTVEQTIRSVKLICACLGCSSDNSVNGNEVSRNIEGFCLTAILGTIKHLVTTLSCVVRDSELKPTVPGIRLVYDDVYQLWSARSNRDDEFWVTLLELARDEHYYMIQDVHVFFGGTSYQSIETLEQPSPRWSYCTASSQGGICVYLNSLTSLSGKAEFMRKVHVKRGHIQWNGRLYSSIWDSMSWNNGILPLVQCGEAGLPVWAIGQPWGETKLNAVITERSSGNRLHFYYRASLPSGESVSLQPGALTQSTLRNTGMISCKKHRCGDALAFPCSHVSQGWRLDSTIASMLRFHAGVACCIWPLDNHILQCIAIQMTSDAETDWNNRIFLRRSECLPCATLDVLRQSSELLSYTMSPGPRAIAWIIG